MRTEDPVLPVGEGSDDFIHSLIACPQIPAIDTGFLDFYRNGLTRAAKIEEGLSDAEKIDVLSMLVSCLASGCERYVHSFRSQTTPSKLHVATSQPQN
jgi:hypothetical protein